MNQSIIFPDIQSWCDLAHQIQFPVQIDARLIECVISVSTLENISGLSISDGEHALKIFTQYRFDIEDIVEEAIQNERYNEQGYVEINQ